MLRPGIAFCFSGFPAFGVSGQAVDAGVGIRLQRCRVRWAKQNRRSPGWFMGGGYGTRHNVEVCWLGAAASHNASLPPCVSSSSRQCASILANQTKYMGASKQLCAGPFLEIFARQQWPGWTCVGDELEKFEREAS